LFACDEPGSGAQGIVPTDSVGAGDVTDTGMSGGTEVATDTVVPETATPETVAPDTATTETVVPDTSVSETVGGETVASVCSGGCLPISATGAPTGIDFRQFGNQGRPTLRGGDAPEGVWELDLVAIYSQGTFADGISVTFSDHGATAGRIGFDGDAIAMALDLDLDVTVTAFGSTGSNSARSLVSLGGCHEVQGARLRGSFSACGEGLASEGSLDFELSATSLTIGVEVSRESLIALLPPDQQEAGDFAIVGPMYLVSTFKP